MNNNLCPYCNGVINDPDAEKCPTCGNRLEPHHYTFSKEDIENRLKTESPDIIIELDKCPMCGTLRENNEKECHNCGFTYVPVGFRYKSYYFDDRGEDYINSLFNKQIGELYENDRTWLTFVAPIATVIILTIILCNLSLSFSTAFAIALIPSLILLIYLYKRLNEPFNKAMNEIRSREQEYNLLQKKWLNLNKNKEESFYGAPDKSVRVGRFQNVGKQIFFYVEKGLLKYDSEFINIKDVLECSLDDEGGGSIRTIGTIKNNTWNVVGRSVVGAAVGGATGAIIGGLTSQKHTEQIETIKHEYFVNISINNPQRPLLRLEFGENVENAREVYSMLQVMLNR